MPLALVFWADVFDAFLAHEPSEEIALIVSNHDGVNGVISITKSRVHGIV